MKLILCSTFCILIVITAIAGENEHSTAAWTQNPFYQKVFIENAGQFDGKTENNIALGTVIDGVELYFTNRGITYKHEENLQMTNQEKEEVKEHNKKISKPRAHYLSMEWVGANPTAEIIPSDPVSFYYTYPDTKGSLPAHAYKKIIYKNIYPGIDVEYISPEEKEGIKYSIMVHSGADVSVIRMRYSTNELTRDEQGNVVVESSFGNFIDHAPLTYYSGNKAIVSSSFIITDNEVSFDIKDYDKTKTLIIDPWTTNPTFPDYNAGYDINYDLAGNVYVYGSYKPFKLAKFNNAGALQWIYTATEFDSPPVPEYGDFVVDELTNTSYLVEGWNTAGSRVLKINTLGTKIGEFPGRSDMNEMYRADYNQCLNKIVVGGGGTSSHYQSAMIDTNMTSLTPINVLSENQPFHDITLLTIDNNSNYCYMASLRSSLDNNHNNVMLKCPLPDLLPLAFSVSDGYKFQENGSIAYVGGVGGPNSYCPANGMNGMSASRNWLYTYDSDSLKRWDKNTGALTASVHVSSSAPLYTFAGGILVYWGGLSVDECDNVYVGNLKSILKYNSALSLVKTFTLADTVYDVKIGPHNKLYACGKGFVTQLDIDSSCISPCSFSCTMLSVVATRHGATNDCCAEFTLNNLFAGGLIYSISAHILTPGVTVKNASGPWSQQPGWSSKNIVWSIPTPGLAKGLSDSLFVCFKNGADSIVRVALDWLDAAGRIICSDTLSISCEPGVSVPRDEEYHLGFALADVYPDPFMSRTTMRFSVPLPCHAMLFVYDMYGREVSRILDENISAGRFEKVFDASHLPAGIYTYTLTAGDYTATRKMLLVK